MSIVSKYIVKFMDDNYTIFTRGPFVIDGDTYEYRLEDNKGADYCTEEQLELWQVSIMSVLDEDEELKLRLGEDEDGL